MLRSHTLVGEAGEAEIKRQRREIGEERMVHLLSDDTLVDHWPKGLAVWRKTGHEHEEQGQCL